MAIDVVVVGSDAVRVARQVGPTAWTVLTALAVDAERGDGQLIVRASVRSLAAELGLNKDTVGRALARLRHAGLVGYATAPFERSAYCLNAPREVVQFSSDTRTEPSRRHQHASVTSGVQLALLDAG